jgi:hypothetical protein
MGKLADLNKRLDAKQREVDRDQDRIEAAWRIIAKKNATAEEIEKGLDQVRTALDFNRRALKDVKKDLDEVREDGVDPNERDDLIELQERREAIADRIDEKVALKQRLLERLDLIAENKAEIRRRVEQLQGQRKEDRDDLDRMRKRRVKIRRQREQKNQPSPNFTYAEFDCNDGTDCPESAYASIKNLCQRVLEPQRARFGSVHINSGYRTPAYNAAIGGASNSCHVYTFHGGKGVAADHTCASGGAADWFNNTAGKADGRGRYSTFHHADVRNELGWPDATWSG